METITTKGVRMNTEDVYTARSFGIAALQTIGRVKTTIARQMMFGSR